LIHFVTFVFFVDKKDFQDKGAYRL